MFPTCEVGPSPMLRCYLTQPLKASVVNIGLGARWSAADYD